MYLHIICYTRNAQIIASGYFIPTARKLMTFLQTMINRAKSAEESYFFRNWHTHKRQAWKSRIQSYATQGGARYQHNRSAVQRLLVFYV